MTLLEIRTLARAQLRDDSANTVSNTDLTNWINVAQRELAHRLRVVQDEATGTTSGNTIALPAGTVSVEHLRLADDDVAFIDSDIWYELSDVEAEPGFYVGRIFEGNIELYPTPDDGTAYTLRVTKEPTNLSADGDTSTLPAETHNRMAWYATAHALYKMREEGMGDRFMAMFEQSLPSNPLGVHKRIPGPFSLTREVSQWDIDGSHV